MVLKTEVLRYEKRLKGLIRNEYSIEFSYSSMHWAKQYQMFYKKGLEEMRTRYCVHKHCFFVSYLLFVTTSSH